MTLMIDIKPELQAELAAQARARGMDVPRYAVSLLEEAVARPPEPTVPQSTKSPEEIRVWLDSMAEFSNQIPSMSGETFSREMIYQEHD